MHRFGLKLWSINTDFYYNEAIRLYRSGVFDYIELYVVPNTIETLDKWKKLNIPFTLHAPHFAHGINLAEPEKFEYNKKIYTQVAEFQKALNPKFTVVHLGIEGHIEEVVRQLKIINPKNILIENKPYRAPLGEKKLCRGANIEEIKYVLENYDCGFCLDIGHAICTANSFLLDQYDYLKEFNKLNPQCYHISQGDIKSTVDMHLHLNQGNFDLKRILKIIDDKKCISIETKKDSTENLNDFEEDVAIFKYGKAAINYFIFDLDDTLYPQAEYTRQCLHNCADTISKYSGVAKEKICAILDTILDKNGIEYKHIFDDLFDEINFDGKSYMTEILEKFRSCKPSIKCHPKANELLDYLKDKAQIALISDGFIDVQKYKLENLKIKNKFDYDKIILTDNFGIKNRKPSTFAFNYFIKENLVNPKRCIYIGNDPKRDFKPAQKVGMKTIRINQGDYKNVQVENSTKSDYEFSSIEELYKNIGEISG